MAKKPTKKSEPKKEVVAITSRSCPKCFGMLVQSDKGVHCSRMRCDYKESP